MLRHAADSSRIVSPKLPCAAHANDEHDRETRLCSPIDVQRAGTLRWRRVTVTFSHRVALTFRLLTSFS